MRERKSILVEERASRARIRNRETGSARCGLNTLIIGINGEEGWYRNGTDEISMRTGAGATPKRLVPGGSHWQACLTEDSRLPFSLPSQSAYSWVQQCVSSCSFPNRFKAYRSARGPRPYTLFSPIPPTRSWLVTRSACCPTGNVALCAA